MKYLAMTVFCVDIYSGRGISCVGGNSLNFAVQCVKSGAGNISVLGAVGGDKYGKDVKDYLEKAGFDISHIYTLKDITANHTIYISENGDRYFLPDGWKGGAYESFRLSDGDWNYFKAHDIIAMPAFDPNLPMALEVKTPNNRLAVDFLDTRDFGYIEKLMPSIEICFISGDEDVVERLAPLSRQFGKLTVVTMGAAGSAALYEGKKYHVPAVPVGELIDTTGCGDAYQAAFTVSWFRHGNLIKAMEAGSLAASQVLSHFGGVNGGEIASINEVDIERELEAITSVIRDSFITVANEMGLTEENCPSNPAFICSAKVREMKDKGVHAFGLYCGKRLVGFVALEKAPDSIYYLERLAVLPEFRHNGYGKLLMDHAFDHVRNQGGRKISIGVVNENTVLKEWYCRYGFAETALKKFNHLPFTVCFMEKAV